MRISVCAGRRFLRRAFSGGVWAIVRRLAFGVSVSAFPDPKPSLGWLIGRDPAPPPPHRKVCGAVGRCEHIVTNNRKMSGGFKGIAPYHVKPLSALAPIDPLKKCSTFFLTG